ncbi:hypothetical protein [Solimonas flava]|uniref:hypothetical protein n=1 Tax=Solimonas flava TaxID=415849 RepID=UPI0012B64866|nr:hypothetical protein [Solimonas flava]
MNSSLHPAPAGPSPTAGAASEATSVEASDPERPVLDTERAGEQETFRSERPPAELELEASQHLGELLPARQPDGWISRSL